VLARTTRSRGDGAGAQPAAPPPQRSQRNQTADERASGERQETTKPQAGKYTTHLRPEMVQAVKRIAFESECKDYEVVQEAPDLYLQQRKGSIVAGRQHTD
jgi:hypothetical protein